RRSVTRLTGLSPVAGSGEPGIVPRADLVRAPAWLIRLVTPPARHLALGRRTLAVLPRTARPRGRPRRRPRHVRRLPAPRAADREDRSGRQSAYPSAVRRVPRGAALRVRLAPHVAGTDPDSAARLGAWWHTGAGGVESRHGRAARRRRARDALLPHHARRPSAAPRVRGGRLPGAERRDRQQPPAGGAGAGLARDRLRRHAELPRQSRRHG